jgi:hypothetical protein
MAEDAATAKRRPTASGNRKLIYRGCRILRKLP